MEAMTVDANKMLHSITIKVKGLRRAELRMRLAAIWFSIGAKIAGTEFEIEWTNS
jgi:hypothetical protein